MTLFGFPSRIFKCWHLLKGMLLLAGARVLLKNCRLPLDLRIASGVRLSVTDGGRANFGRGCSIDRNATIIIKHGSFELGARGYVGTGSVIVARESVRIGRDALIAEYVTIRDQDHAFGGPMPTGTNGFTTAPVVIGDNVWLGAKVTITKGVTIGENSVIGANSVVTRDIPANVLAAGVPARVIRALELGQ